MKFLLLCIIIISFIIHYLSNFNILFIIIYSIFPSTSFFKDLSFAFCRISLLFLHSLCSRIRKRFTFLRAQSANLAIRQLTLTSATCHLPQLFGECLHCVVHFNYALFIVYSLFGCSNCNCNLFICHE